MKILIMAWRNLWRNKKRTLITASSLYFAVVFAIIMRSMQLGTYDAMIDGAVQSYSGYIQVQDSLYFKEKSLDDLMIYDPKLDSILNSTQGVISVLPRLETFGLASTGNKTKGVILQGILPEADDAMTRLSRHLISGEYLSSNTSGIVVSSRLATYLKLSVGDTLVLISQGYQGASAADQYRVQGIVKIPMPILDNKLILMNLSQAQEFANAYDMVTSLAINIDNHKNMNIITDSLKQKLEGTNLLVLQWLDMDKVLRQQIESDNASGIIMLIILYMVIFFGILGTIIMMTTERIREFGVMASLGMSRFRMIWMMLLETVFIGFLGIIAGAVTCVPIIYYFKDRPIRLGGEMAQASEAYGMEPVMAFSPDPFIFYNQFITVLLLMLITLSYPVMKLIRLNIINAIRG
jgi:ABC-type lipoprotein release transport system permease subunit